MRRKKKSGAGKMIAAVVVVVILLCGIFAIMKNLASPASADNKAGNKEGNSAKATEASTEAPDNSVPMTGLKVTAPATTIRVGQTMQLKISHEPSNATNTKLKWSCSKDGMVTVTKDGVLKPGKNAGKNTVKVTATATDGSKLSASFDLRIYPAIDPSKPMVAITFDDGPSYNTIKIVNTLVKYDSKATFFLVGNQIEKYAKTMDVLVKNGMDIGNHTYSHKELTKLRDKEILKEIDLTNEVIYNKTGIKPMFLRPSYGAMNKRIKKLSTMPIIVWNIDTLDWKYHNSNKIKDKILKYVSDGDIILMHDTYVATLNAVEMVIPELKKQGYKIVSVNELFKYKGVKPKLGIGYGYVGGRNE